MSGWPGQPVIYEINTAVWLTELSEAAGQRLTLADVPAAAWDDVTPAGVDAVWLMGVWQRSPAGLALAMANPDLLASFRDALPDLTSSDVIGSPYCVRGYLVDAAFGGPDALAAAHTALRDRGVSLLLDYVPNHVAPDHPWVSDSPELFVRGSEDDIQSDPASWLRAGSNILARGRDPYFPPWPDVVQLNAFSPALRATAAETLAGIAAQCDGIRCDMAMLMTNKVFANTWAGRAGAEPVHEFWPEVIAGMRARHPDTVLIAEAYWDMEWDLQEDGFDFCYDKRLYDRIVGEDANAVRDHLRADLSYQRRLLRFLENHDDPAIASRFPPEAQPPAAVAISTLPGATLWHEGQFEGRRVRPPVFLGRRPHETVNAELAEWYRRLLAAVDQDRVRAGQWRLLEIEGWRDNQSCRNLLAWLWSGEEGVDGHLVVINLSGQPAQGRVRLDWPRLEGRSWQLVDPVQDVSFDRDGTETSAGLFVDLGAWQFHLLAIRPSSGLA